MNRNILITAVIALIIVSGAYYFLPSSSTQIETQEEKTKVSDSSIKGIVPGIRAAAEMEYSNNFSNPSYNTVCNSSFVTTNAKSIGLVCRDTDTSYMVYAKLSSGTYYCSDSAATTVELQTEPLGTLCK